jgi:hypothetical protein
MKFINGLILLWRSSIIVAEGNDHQHSFIRRAQVPQLPLCGAPPSTCWCDLISPSSTSKVCPAYPTEAIYTHKTDVADFFASLELMNPDYKDLKLCYPDLSTSVNLEGVSINPEILCDEGILVGGKAAKSKSTSTQCLQACKPHPDTAVCGIKLMHDGCDIDPHEYGDSCSGNLADSYLVRTFRNDEKREGSKYFPFHEGACGVCSTTQDMASFMRYSYPDLAETTVPHPTIDTMSFLCHMAVTQMNPGISAKDLVDQVALCLQQGYQGVPSADLSPNCAYAWGVNVFLTGLPESVGGCNIVCSEMLSLLLTGDCKPDMDNKCPYNPVNCSLHECLRCDDSVSGSQFIQLSGNTRRFAGIHTMLPRPCGSLADISHTCVAKL